MTLHNIILHRHNNNIFKTRTMCIMILSLDEPNHRLSRWIPYLRFFAGHSAKPPNVPRRYAAVAKYQRKATFARKSFRVF